MIVEINKVVILTQVWFASWAQLRLEALLVVITGVLLLASRRR